MQVKLCCTHMTTCLQLSRKWDHASCTRTCKHTGDRLFDTKANRIYLWIWKEQYSKNRVLQFYPTLSISTSVTWRYICGSWWPNGWVSALHAEGCGFESHADTFPVFFCWGICCAGVDLCCLSLIVTLWVGKLFLSYTWLQSTPSWRWTPSWRGLKTFEVHSTNDNWKYSVW